MGDSDRDQPEDEIQRLRDALEAETRRCLDVQRQLDRASAEIEAFISMAVHDLRESLRDVTAFSQLIAETDAGSGNPDAVHCLNRIQGGAARMQSLLADVMDYWSTGTDDRPSCRTDLVLVLNQALLCTDKQIKGANAVVTHDPLPAVMGDFETLSKILHHLIRNAVQYCGTSSPRVHVSARRDHNDWVLSVQDNGPGIEPEFQGRLFGVFKRLHGKEQPGNGLGLAFCKRAIEWHGGRIWMESNVGAGSTFYFTVAAAD